MTNRADLPSDVGNHFFISLAQLIIKDEGQTIIPVDNSKNKILRTINSNQIKKQN